MTLKLHSRTPSLLQDSASVSANSVLTAESGLGRKLQHAVTSAQSGELASQAQRYAKAIVCVFETRWKRAPCGAAAELDLVAPRATSRNTSLSAARALRIFRRRIPIITGIVIVAAPLVNAFAHVVKSEVVGSVSAHSLRPAGFQIVTCIRSIRRLLIAPWVKRTCKLATRRSLPLGLARQAELFAGSSA